MQGSDPIDRVEALLAAMTLEEKLGQLTMVTVDPAVPGPSGAPLTA